MYDPSNMSVVDFAQQIRTRAPMYFGPHIKFSFLQNMLWGFNENAQKESIVPFQYFNYWAKHKLNKFGATYNWGVAILESCDNDERRAFDKFYELLDEFIALRPRKLLVAELSEANLAFYYSRDNEHKAYRLRGDRRILDPAPYHIKLFEFNYCIHAYHFDYYWLVNEYDKNLYYRHFDNLKVCKAFYKASFNLVQWTEVDSFNIENSYIDTINNCRNRRSNII